ncbi:MAG: hypothetical protein ACUVXA_07990 [Candidatus Jordarchaeum sp.]
MTKRKRYHKFSDEGNVDSPELATLFETLNRKGLLKDVFFWKKIV